MFLFVDAHERVEATKMPSHNPTINNAKTKLSFRCFLHMTPTAVRTQGRKPVAAWQNANKRTAAPHKPEIRQHHLRYKALWWVPVYGSRTTCDTKTLSTNRTRKSESQHRLPKRASPNKTEQRLGYKGYGSSFSAASHSMKSQSKSTHFIRRLLRSVWNGTTTKKTFINKSTCRHSIDSDVHFQARISGTKEIQEWEGTWSS